MIKTVEAVFDGKVFRPTEQIEIAPIVGATSHLDDGAKEVLLLGASLQEDVRLCP
jgi:hypothetical protein